MDFFISKDLLFCLRMFQCEGLKAKTILFQNLFFKTDPCLDSAKQMECMKTYFDCLVKVFFTGPHGTSDHAAVRCFLTWWCSRTVSGPSEPARVFFFFLHVVLSHSPCRVFPFGLSSCEAGIKSSVNTNFHNNTPRANYVLAPLGRSELPGI